MGKPLEREMKKFPEGTDGLGSAVYHLISELLSHIEAWYACFNVFKNVFQNKVVEKYKN